MFASSAGACTDPVKVEVQESSPGFVDIAGAESESTSGDGLLDGACVTDTQAAERRKVAVYMMLDSSGSMEERTGNSSTKWQAVQRALRSFLFETRETDDLALGLQFFPLLKRGSKATCTTEADCGPEGGPCFLNTCVRGTTITLCRNDSECEGGPALNPCLPFGLCEGSDPAAPTACVLGDGANLCDNGLGRCQDFERTCTNATECTVARYAEPAVEIGDVATNLEAIDLALNTQTPQGLTPTVPALSGAMQHAREWAISHPDQTVVTVLATDGLPTECGPEESATPPIERVLDIASTAAAAADYPIRTFVIGVFQPGDAASINNVNAIAASGGTERAVFIDSSGGVEDQFLEALRAIRSGTLACEFQVPRSDAALDYFTVNMLFENNAGQRQTLPYVGNSGGCDGTPNGWHYDVDPTSARPNLIRVCPNVCEQFKAATSGNLSVQLGCATIIR